MAKCSALLFKNVLSDLVPASRLTAIIVAAGSSRRLGFDKLSAQLCGQPVLRRAVAAFSAAPFVDRCIVVAQAERIPEIASMLVGMGDKIAVIAGGAERHQSVWAGICSADDAAWIAVHDGARPLIRTEVVAACFALACRHGAASCAEPVTDTLQRADGNLRISETVDRTGLWKMQTPQIFEAGLLRAAYRSVMDGTRNVTDETTAVLGCGREVYLYETPVWNFKITYPRDLELARAVLQTGGRVEAD